MDQFRIRQQAEGVDQQADLAELPELAASSQETAEARMQEPRVELGATNERLLQELADLRQRRSAC